MKRVWHKEAKCDNYPFLKKIFFYEIEKKNLNEIRR